MSRACCVPTTRQLTFADIAEIIQPTFTPMKKAKPAGKKQGAVKEPVVVQDRDCSKNAAMKGVI